MSELDAEMEAIRLNLARRFREYLEGDDHLQPAFLDVARRFLLDNTPKARPVQHAPPIITDLPFPDQDD